MGCVPYTNSAVMRSSVNWHAPWLNFLLVVRGALPWWNFNNLSAVSQRAIAPFVRAGDHSDALRWWWLQLKSRTACCAYLCNGFLSFVGFGSVLRCALHDLAPFLLKKPTCCFGFSNFYPTLKIKLIIVPNILLGSLFKLYSFFTRSNQHIFYQMNYLQI